MCAHRQALKPRLLVPVGLAAGMAAYNHVAQQPLHGIEQASLLTGFLSYKVPNLPFPMPGLFAGDYVLHHQLLCMPL